MRRMSDGAELKSPVVIIGAGRSGTKVLRDLLCRHSHLVTWPCDEINAIWRYRHAGFPHDALPPSLADGRVKDYVRSRFESIRRRMGGQRVVEKTCANSLRVEYVHRIVPEAQYLHLVRDGRDVAVSARRRWCRDESLAYLLRKARFVPLRDVPHQAWDFFANRVDRAFNQEKRRRRWGPRFPEMDELAKEMPLLELCGAQWARCVQASRKGFAAVEAPVFEVRYEELVRDPVEWFGRIFEFLKVDFEPECKNAVGEVIQPTSVGSWKRELTQSEQDRLHDCISAALAEEGYL